MYLTYIAAIFSAEWIDDYTVVVSFYKLLASDKKVAAARRTGKELKRAKKSRAWKKRARTGLALSGVSSIGFHATKRSDLKGQSI